MGEGYLQLRLPTAKFLAGMVKIASSISPNIIEFATSMIVHVLGCVSMLMFKGGGYIEKAR